MGAVDAAKRRATLQDLTVVLTASSLFGCFFEAIKQPVLNGYILAGSLVGPDGFALVKEMVQVESLAQVGVQLLLFGLGMEFSIEKLKEVGSVAIIGGFIQIVLFITIAAVGALAIGAALSEGIFVGALISMSSTSVVIKSLGERAGDRSSQIVVGTLILQDCTVGLMFALMPVLASLNDPKNGLNSEATGEIIVLILKVLFKLVMTLAATAALSTSIVPAVVTQLKLRFSDELFQLTMVGYCLSCALICGKLGLSHELGAFLAGIMVRNVFTGLFLASIGLVISPIFILEHIRLLSIGAAVVLLLKASLISIVVWNFGISWNTAVTVGISLAQVGEFAFVLLSLATQLGLITSRLSMLLLGVTAISLLTTPIVFTLAHHLLPREAAACLPQISPASKRMMGREHADKTPLARTSSAATSKASFQRASRAAGTAEQVEDDADSPWVGVGECGFDPPLAPTPTREAGVAVGVRRSDSGDAFPAAVRHGQCNHRAVAGRHEVQEGEGQTRAAGKLLGPSCLEDTGGGGSAGEESERQWPGGSSFG